MNFSSRFLSFLQIIGFIATALAIWVGVAIGLHFLAGGGPIGSGPRVLLSVGYGLWPLSALVLLGIPMVIDSIMARGARFEDNLPKKRYFFPLERVSLRLDGFFVGPVTAAATAFYFLPIICNGVSALCNVVGWNTAAGFLFQIRWVAPIFTFFSLIIFIIAAVLISAFWQWITHKIHNGEAA